jgi:short-subunit dehydrogenase
MAYELARKGLSVLLVSRSKDKLDACKQEIKEKYPLVEVHILNFFI